MRSIQRRGVALGTITDLSGWRSRTIVAASPEILGTSFSHAVFDRRGAAPASSAAFTHPPGAAAGTFGTGRGLGALLFNGVADGRARLRQVDSPTRGRMVLSPAWDSIDRILPENIANPEGWSGRALGMRIQLSVDARRRNDAPIRTLPSHPPDGKG